jgi:hypothetical protein
MPHVTNHNSNVAHFATLPNGDVANSNESLLCPPIRIRHLGLSHKRNKVKNTGLNTHFPLKTKSYFFDFSFFLESYINLAWKKKMNSKIQPQILQYFGQRATIQVN